MFFFREAVFAQSLELQYPQLPGAQLSQRPALPEFIRYLYVFSVLAAGFIAVGSAVYGGFKYMVSGGNPTAKGEARAQITGGVLGALVILAGYLLLTTINPQLVIFKIAKPTAQIPTVTTCDCFNPVTDQCKQTCEREGITSSFLEIPVGTLIEKVLDQGRLDEFEQIAESLDETYAKKVMDKSKELKEEIDRCKCSRTTVIPACSGGELDCRALQCSGEPCDKVAIDKKKVELDAALEELSNYVNANIGINITAE
ncbi:MAG: hypothetical protein Q7R48_04115 [bacterium]|nr:hypothetical protein [bacterium]